MMGHLNDCMLLGFRNKNKNETLELLYCSEPRRRDKNKINNNYYSSPSPNMNLFVEGNFLLGASAPYSITYIVRFSVV